MAAVADQKVSPTPVAGAAPAPEAKRDYVVQLKKYEGPNPFVSRTNLEGCELFKVNLITF
jgi:hypothetical protein